MHKILLNILIFIQFISYGWQWRIYVKGSINKINYLELCDLWNQEFISNTLTNDLSTIMSPIVLNPTKIIKSSELMDCSTQLSLLNNRTITYLNDIIHKNYFLHIVDDKNSSEILLNNYLYSNHDINKKELPKVSVEFLGEDNIMNIFTDLNNTVVFLDKLLKYKTLETFTADDQKKIKDLLLKHDYILENSTNKSDTYFCDIGMGLEQYFTLNNRDNMFIITRTGIECLYLNKKYIFSFESGLSLSFFIKSNLSLIVGIFNNFYFVPLKVNFYNKSLGDFKNISSFYNTYSLKIGLRFIINNFFINCLIKWQNPYKYNTLYYGVNSILFGSSITKNNFLNCQNSIIGFELSVTSK